MEVFWAVFYKIRFRFCWNKQTKAKHIWSCRRNDYFCELRKHRLYVSGSIYAYPGTDMRKVKILPRAAFWSEKFPQKCVIQDCFQFTTKGHI